MRVIRKGETISKAIFKVYDTEKDIIVNVYGVKDTNIVEEGAYGLYLQPKMDFLIYDENEGWIYEHSSRFKVLE